MPATPMNDAALRYSPEMALAFQPTLTLRPATKKSCAVRERRADQKPMKTVATTVSAPQVRRAGSMFIWFAGGKVRKWESERSLSGHWASFLEEPDFGAIAHVNELAEDAIEQAMEFPSLRLRHVLAIHSMHDQIG